MIKIKHIALTLLATTAFISCKNDTKVETVKEEIQKVTTNTPEITIEKLANSPSYADAVLSLNSPSNMKITDGKDVDFNFKVENYGLGEQTESTNVNLLANSGKGQHIHFILNNEPYSAHYDPTFNKELPDGVHHLVAFLSRSYHESVKNKNSVVVKKVEVGTNPQDALGLDIDAPTLIYSRPKGTYKGKDAENLMLDFFVLNTTLSEDGNKVKATVNGKEFMITEWAPQVLKGLPKGEITIQLELVDKQGSLIPGPFNKVTRTVTLTE